MPPCRALALCAAAAAALSSASDAGVTPVQKVIDLLQGMLTKGKEDKHSEEVEFAEFQAWCDGTRTATKKSIKEAEAQITQFSADLAKAESDAEVLGQEVRELDGRFATAKADSDAAKKVREKERADYLAQHQDFSESIDAIRRALAVLKSRSADVPQSLMQVGSSPRIPPEARSLIESFLEMRAGSAAGQAPQPNAYEFASTSVVDMLEKLEGRFKEERLALETAEMNARSNHELLMQQLSDNMLHGEARSKEKTAAKAGKLHDAARAKGDLAVTQRTKAEDERALLDTNTACHSRSVEFEQNQVTRSEELKAIQKAVDVLSSDAVSGHAATYLPSLAQLRRRGTALPQLRRAAPGGGYLRQKLAAYLQGRAHSLGSKYLSVVASRALEDPFSKVRQMIKDLIVKLLEEANSEADHHAYCTSELAMNKQTREDKTAEVEKLSADADQLTATAARLASELTELSDAMSEMQGSRAEATRIRAEEKAANNKAIEDAKEAQVAVQRAMSALRAFYNQDQGASSSGSAALLQAHQRGAAAVAKRSGHREPYTGMTSESGGVLGLLEVIFSDFARLETEMSSTEDQAEAAYEHFMAESSQDLAVKSTTQEHRERSKQQTEESLHRTKKELALTQEELDAATNYYDKLKADCVDLNLSYEDRVRMRQEEIQSLKEALRILNGEDSLA